MSDDASETQRLWADYKQTRAQDLRDKLIIQYSPLVKYVAGRVGVGLPRNVEQSDLVSFGVFGLIDAIEKFDPARGYKFETYAIARIKGAILDELRSIDWVPRSVRSKARTLERAMGKLEAEHHRAPTDEEVADEMGVSPQQLQTTLSQISFVGVAALDEMLSGGDRGESVTLGDTVADTGDGPMGVYEVEEMRQVLADVDQSHAGTREDRPHALLLRGSDPRRDRSCAERDREPRVSDPHEGRAAVAIAYHRHRARAGLALRQRLAHGRRYPLPRDPKGEWCVIRSSSRPGAVARAVFRNRRRPRRVWCWHHRPMLRCWTRSGSPKVRTVRGTGVSSTTPASVRWQRRLPTAWSRFPDRSPDGCSSASTIPRGSARPTGSSAGCWSAEGPRFAAVMQSP